MSVESLGEVGKKGMEGIINYASTMCWALCPYFPYIISFNKSPLR